MVKLILQDNPNYTPPAPIGPPAPPAPPTTDVAFNPFSPAGQVTNIPSNDLPAITPPDPIKVDPRLAAAQAIQAKAKQAPVQGSSPAPDPSSLPVSSVPQTGPAPSASTPSANYTGDLAANRDAAVADISARKAEVDKQIELKRQGIEEGTATSADLSKLLNTRAALDIAGHKVDQQYPLNPDGSINWQGIKPGQFSAKQLGIFQAGDQIHYANENQRLAAERIKAFDEQTKAESTKNAAIAKANEATTQLLDNHIALTTQHQNEYNAGLQEVNKKYDQSMSDFAGAHVDPKKYWKETSTPALIGIAVMAGLEQGFKALAGGGQAGSPSSIVATVNTLVQQDIDAQNEEIAKKGKLVDLAGNAVAHFRAQGMDQQQADAAALNLGLLKANQTIDSIAAQNADPIAKAKADQVKTELEQQANTARQAAIAPAVAGLAKLLAPTPVGNPGGLSVVYDKDSGKYYKVDIHNKVVGLATGAEAKTYEETKHIREKGGTPSAASERYKGNSTVVDAHGERYVADNPKNAATVQGRIDYAKKAKDAGARLLALGTKVANPITVASIDHNQQIDQAALDYAVAVEKWENPNQAVNADTLKEAHRNLDPGSAQFNWLPWADPNNRGVIEKKNKEIEEATALDLAKLPKADEYKSNPGEEGHTPTAEETEEK